jgi:octaheme c-type cytochrome (tetrathionate reductase family)
MHMKVCEVFFCSILALFVVSNGQAIAANGPWLYLPEFKSPTDHSTFFNGPFADGPSVTRACLDCHPKAASDIMQTAHWNLVGDPVRVPGHEQPMRIGKRNLINNFCIGIQSNWPGCTSCHIGFGWKDDSFDFSDESLVDCLVCHEQTGNYQKKSGDAGLPAADVDLLASARSVARPTRANCGTCHFAGGGGNAVKHGDLDESLLFPNPEIDSHMGKLGFQCVDCHQAEDHLPPGRLLTVSVDDANRLQCTDCHKSGPGGESIHDDRRIDGHTDRVACQTCHIPLMAFKEGTKLSWDWSEAGQDLPVTNEHLYLKIKGRFTWVKGAPPEYAWYNGTASRYLLGDRIDPDKVTKIAAPLGDRSDPKAKIYPFKIHRGKQVYDSVYSYFLLPHVYGDEGFWKKFDWDTALRIGAETTGLAYSGHYDFAPTEMYMPQNHMVVPKQRALQCPDCHGEAGRMNWRQLGYSKDPLARAALEHDPIPMLDTDGEMVHESGNPLSTSMTCSQCHDIEEQAFIQAHAYHANVLNDDLPANRRLLMQQGPRLPQQDDEQMNCFLCHLEKPDLDAWQTAIHSGEPEWAVSATLLGTGILQQADKDFKWNDVLLDEDEMASLPISQPQPAHCGNCHGFVYKDNHPLRLALGSDANWQTETTGQVFSAQPIRLSALNLRDKDDLSRAWDIHAQRMVECNDCHYASEPPKHLIKGDDSNMAGGKVAGLRSCSDCHTDTTGHDWLPERERHFSSVACEACHIPHIYLPARQQVDASVITQTGQFPVHYRGLDKGKADDLGRAFISGYQPLLIKRDDADGLERWAPMNLVSRWYWVDAASGTEVDMQTLRDAWLDDDAYLPEILHLFDADGDAHIGEDELRLDNPKKLELIRQRLLSAGVTQPELKADLRGYHLHHNVALHDASRDCARCHEQVRNDGMRIADYLPGGVLPDRFHGLPESMTRNLADNWRQNPDGSLVLPQPGPIATSKAKAKGK